MKASEFAAMNTVQLNDKIKDLKSELFTLRFQLATGQLENTMQIVSVKRDIARAKTVLRAMDQKQA